jgi:hypothetical protein
LKKKPEEKRVLPVRMRGLGGSSGTGSNITGKDVEDMIYQCFSRTCEAPFRLLLVDPLSADILFTGPLPSTCVETADRGLVHLPNN